jgi:peptide/nickel transport system substrate-binding protein
MTRGCLDLADGDTVKNQENGSGVERYSGRVFVKFAFLVCLAMSSACTEKNAGADQTMDSTASMERQKSLTIGISQEPDSLWIPFKEMLASEEVARPTAYTLTIFDENRRLIPWAAKEIPTEKNGQLVLFQEDGKTKMRATWVLRDEFNWPDGTPLTADDFVLGFEIFKDPAQEIVDRTVVEKIESMKAEGADRKTLVVTWKEPFAYYANFRQHEAVPVKVVRPLYESQAGELKKHPFGIKPQLAGAFTIQEWVAGSHITAVRNPNAKGFLVPKLDRITWRIIPQTNTLEANIVSGTIDAISPIGLSFDQAVEFEKRHGDKFNVHFTEGLVWEHIDFNLDNPILADIRVRRALAHGANRQLICDELFFGRQPVAHGTQPPKSVYYNPDVMQYPFDPIRAKELLAEAGWLPGARGIRFKDGKPLKLVLMTTSGNKMREQVETILQSQWRDLGVQIEIKNQPAKVFFSETMRKRKYSGMMMFAWTADPVRMSDTLWRCDNVPNKENNYQGQNIPGWCNPKATELISAMSTEMDADKRHSLGKQFEKVWAEELPALPLYFRVDVSVTRKGLRNWKPTGTLQPVGWNAHEWEWN